MLVAAPEEYIAEAMYYDYDLKGADVSITGIKRLYDKIDRDLKTFWSSSVGHQTFLAIRREIVQYWRTNIYNHFERHSGNLGKACYVSLERDGSILVHMAFMYHTWVGPNGTRTYEYSRFLRYGTKASKGRYVPEIDARVESGEHPGVSRRPWLSWMREFKEFVQITIKERLREGLIEYLQGESTSTTISQRQYQRRQGPNTKNLWVGSGVQGVWR